MDATTTPAAAAAALVAGAAVQQTTASEIVADVANGVLHTDARTITLSGPVTINVYNYGDCGDDGEDLGSQDTDDDDGEDDDDYITGDDDDDDDVAEQQVPPARLTNNGKRMPNDGGTIAPAGRTPPAPATAAYKVPVARKQQRHQ